MCCLGLVNTSLRKFNFYFAKNCDVIEDNSDYKFRISMDKLCKNLYLCEENEKKLKNVA